jgi:Mrp family chromosome partitioning ATPase
MHVRFEALLNKLSGEFDVLIIDAPPILAVSDAAIIGRHAGATLIAARAGKHPISEFEQTIKRLNRAGVQVKGFIFNNVNIDRQRKHYGYKGYVFQYSYKQPGPCQADICGFNCIDYNDNYYLSLRCLAGIKIWARNPRADSSGD